MTLGRTSSHAQGVRFSGRTLTWRRSSSGDTASAFPRAPISGQGSRRAASIRPTSTRKCLQLGQARGIQSP